jgi:type IV pilus assembly protein PilC
MSAAARLPLSSLIELCRALRYYLGAGLSLVDVFRSQAKKGPWAVRPVAERIAAELERGGDLATALKREADVFPPLLVSLASVGEETGMLPEVFTELEKYFVRQQKLRRQFFSRAAWPLTQFFLAIFVLAGLIFVLGLLPVNQGPAGTRYDPLGLGLTGPGGALKFLGVVFGLLLALAVGYRLASRSLKHKAAVDAFLLRVPAVGPCLRALALSRFCLALRLTMETALPVGSALRLSLRATGNGAFAERAGTALETVRGGHDVAVALARVGLFPEEFRNVVATAEEAGRLPEVLRHQGEQYDEEAGRRLTVLVSVAAWGVWLLVAVFIIFTVFRLYGSYLAGLNV